MHRASPLLRSLPPTPTPTMEEGRREREDLKRKNLKSKQISLLIELDACVPSFRKQTMWKRKYLSINVQFKHGKHFKGISNWHMKLSNLNTTENSHFEAMTKLGVLGLKLRSHVSCLAYNSHSDSQENHFSRREIEFKSQVFFSLLFSVFNDFPLHLSTISSYPVLHDCACLSMTPYSSFCWKINELKFSQVAFSDTVFSTNNATPIVL